MRVCLDCGTKLVAGGVCPNCDEELIIVTDQAVDIEAPLSPEFAAKVEEQIERAAYRLLFTGKE